MTTDPWSGQLATSSAKNEMLDELRAELAFAQRLPERRPGAWDKLPAYLDALRSRMRELETIGD